MHVHFESLYTEKVNHIVLIVENTRSFPRNVFLFQQLYIPLL